MTYTITGNMPKQEDQYTPYIYKITLTKDGEKKYYIGSKTHQGRSKYLDGKWYQCANPQLFLKGLYNGMGKVNEYLKEGWTISERAVLETFTDAKGVGKREQELLQEVNAKSNESYLNETESGALYYTADIKNKISEANKGKKLTEEHKKKVSNANKGKKLSEATKKKVSETLKGRKLSEATKKKMSEAHIGKVKSAETRKKLSEAHKGKKLTEEHKKKMIVTKAWASEDIDKLVTMREQGMSYVKIAKVFNVTYPTIINQYKKAKGND